MFNIHKLSAQRLAKSLTRRRVVSVAEREALRLLQLEDRCNPAPVPTLSAPYDADILLGETANYGFVFSNASGTDTGYAPYLDVAVDTSGADGNDGYAGYPTVVAGGLQMTPVGIPIVLNIGQTTYTNPFTGQTRPVPTGFGAGDTILVYELPFGSFTPGQSTAVSVTAPTSNLADVGHSLPIAFTPGFKSDNPGLSGPPIPGTEVSANATPELYRFRKVYLGPEDETATGPNHPQWYRLEVDIATGQTIDNLTITDLLADSMQITGLTTAQMSAFLASSGLTTDVFNASNATGNPGVPGGTVSYDFGSVTGVDGVDAAFEFQFYVPRDRAVGAGAVLPQTPLTGTDSVLATNTGSTTGTWDPLDTRDGTNVVVSKSEPDNGPHTLQEQSLATQKTVVATDLMGVPLPDGAPIQPGQTLLKYTIDFQVSDYYAFQNLTLQDLIGDGQRLYLGSDGNNPTFLPTLSVTNAYLYNIGGGSRTDLAASAFGGGNILYRQLYTSTAGGDPTGYPASGPNDLLTSGAFTNLPANILPNTNPYAGSTFLQFNISNELIRKLGANAGRLVGGEINNDGSGPDNDPFSGPHLSGTTGKIVYYVLVSQEFSNEHAFVDNSNEATVDQGDILNNSVPLDNSPEAQAAAGNAVGFTGIRGDQIHPSTINNTLPIVIGQGTDDTAASIDIPIGEQTKTVYAINGQTIPTQGAGDTVYSVQPGDTVTYKLTYTLPISRFEDLQLIDLPPLPVMPVGPASGYNFHATGAPTYTIGEITVASDDTFFSTFSGVTLAISTDATQNSLKLDFGDFHDSAARSTTISLLVTFKVSNAAFADDLFLTNQLRINEDTTNQGTVTVEDLRRFELVRPFVTINKGVVGYNTTGRNLGGIAFHNPTLAAGFTGTIDTAAEASAIGAANVSVGNGVDAGDKVRFAIVAQNTGRGDAYDVKITDAIPTQYQEVAAADANAFITATGLKVFRGDGTTLLTLGTDYTLAWDSTFHTFTITLIDNYTAGNVNNTGTSRDDRNGALSRGEAADASGNAIPIANGSNTIVVLYDLTLKNDVTPNQLLTNTAKVTDYASSEGGDDLTDPDKVPGATEPTDTATVTTALPLTSKTLDGTSVNAPGNDPANQATIGELVTYTVTVTVPEGVTPNAHYLDTLDSGLAFVDVISASATSGLTFSGGGLPTNGTSPANATVTNSGRNIDFSFGTITNNTNANNGGTETITITFRAVVLNISGNQSGVQRSNSAQFQWQDNTNTLASIRAGQSTNATSGVTGSQTRVTIVEPSVTPAKTVRNDTQTPTGPFSEIVRADAGDTVRYQIVLTASGTTAYDVTLNDDIPASLTGLSVASVSTGGTVYRNGSLATGGNVFVPSNFVFMGNTLTLAATVILDMEPGATLTVEVTGTFQGATGNIIPNTAQVDWTSLNGEPGTISSYNTSSTERTGADGPGGLNDYQDSDDANIESPIVVRKTIVDTSEASTTGNNVAVGEIVRYRLVASIPEGTANNFQLQDFIPSGLAFLNDGSAKYAFVSNGGGITSTAITDINGLASPATVSGNETTLAGLSSSLVTGVFNNNNIAISSTGHGTGDAIIYSNGQAVYFRFGNLQNSDNDTDFEYVVVEFNALVGNATNNQSGANRDNTFTVLLDTDGNGSAGYVDVVRDVNGDGTGSGEPTTQANDPDNDATTGTPIDQAAQSAPVSVTIVEPVITNLALSANVATADAGDVVTYTATFSNTGNATAFDVSLTDLLSAGNLTLVSGSVVTSSGTVTTGNGGSDTTVRVDIPSVPVGGSVTITYQATLNGTVNPNQVITTNAGVTYTSLPGANGSVPFYGTVATTLGASGDPYGERNGQDGVPTNSPPTTPLNNYADTDPATLNVPNGNVVKTVQTTDLSSTSGTDVAVGETVTYRLTVTLPEGTTTGLVVTDNLPAGMQYVAGSANVITTGFNGNTGAAPTVNGGTGDGDDITFSFGTITVDGDNNTSNNSFIIEFQAIVLKVSGNEGILPVQTTLNNAATLQVGTGPIVTTPDVPVTVVEPQLQVVKSVVNADTSIDAGTTVQYQVVISHTNKSTGPAFDLSINDLLASIGMDLVVGSVGITNPGYGIQSVTSGNTAGDTNVAVTVSELRLGDTITVTYSAVLQGAADSGPAPGSTVTNTVKVDYDTFPGETPQERQEPQIQGTADITVNTYSVSGNIYRDLNNNGVYEPGSGETLITGSVDLLLTGKDHQGNDVSIPLNTINGTYIFSGLRPSDASGYTITQVTQPTGLLDGRDTPGTPFTGTGTAATDDRGTPQVPARDADAISAIVIPLNAAQDGTANAGVNYNFGELPAASLGDFVFVDTNGNGVQDVGEPGLNGVTVQLTGTDDTGHPVNLTTTTANMSGVDGKYLFTGLRPSDANGYTVTFTAPSGYFFTVPNSTLLWATDANDSDATPQGGTTGTTGGYVIVAGQNETSVDAGLYQPVTIGDTVFYDTNGNGIQDGTMNLPEPGIPSVQVTLLYAGPDGDFATTGDNASFTTLTDANGSYSFANRIPGVYKVQVDTVTVSASGTVPDGLTATTATTQLTTPMLLTSGSTDQDRDFGFRGSGAVGDRVFLDVNGNGVYDAGEGLDGVTVTISGDLDGNGTIESDEVLTTTTGPDGYYQFANLRTSPVGVTYTVTVNPADLPEDGLGNILTNTIDPDTANPGDNTSQVTLTNAAPSNQDQDFGYQGPGLIGDTIFLDVNNNGMPDPGEGITGVPVTLTGDVDGDGTLETFVTTTDANGVYDFSHLPVANKNGTPITYTVTVDTSDLPTGVTNTVDPDTPSPGNSTSQVTLSGAAPVDLDQDFGYRGTGSIGDRVFLDLNGDGVWNAGEGIANVHVTLTADVNGDGVSETFTAITDVDGYYDFTGLPVYQKDGTTPVSYTVAVNTGDLPVGVTNTADPDGGTANQSVLTLVGNPNNNLQDFGYQGTGSLGDRVWLDSDGNGLQGSLLLEPGLPSVDLTLTFAGQDGVLGTADDITTTVFSKASNDPTEEGTYLFQYLPPGQYQVTVNGSTLPGNVTQTYDLDGTGTANQATRSLANGENATDVDFGYVGNASLGDRVYIDQDGDGIQDVGEPGIPGVVVQLTWAGPDGMLDTPDDVVYQTTTTAELVNGNYLFSGLPVSNGTDQYRVEVVSLPVPGFVLTDSMNDGALNPTNLVVVSVSGTEGDPQNDRRDVDFGYDGGTGQTIAGTVYVDLDNSGAQDTGEPGIPGVTLRLTGTDIFGRPVVDPATNLPYFEVVTDVNGNYVFNTVVPGTYTITEFQPTAYNDGQDAAGKVNGVYSGAAGNDVIAGIEIRSGEDGTDYDFGEIGTTLSGTVYRDDNRDGTIGGSEPSLGGVTLELQDASGNPVDDPNQPGIQPYIVTTGPDGRYQFENIPAGNYKVVETQPAGYADSPIGPTTSRDVLVPLAGIGGQDFGEVLGSLSGFVYVDTNNNGIRDAGESPIPNVPVTLTGMDSLGNTVSRTVVTGADGMYVFDNLFPADGTGYTVTEGVTPPYTDGLPNAAGTVGGTANGPNVFESIPLAAGQAGTTYNFGEILPPAPFLSGSVYVDANQDGVRQTGETGIAGVTVTLLDAGPDGKLGTADDGASQTATTDASGNYLFTGLTAGRNYQIVETQPGAYGDSPAGPQRVISVSKLPATGSTGNNFGEVLGSLAGSVYFDANNSGIRDAGETGIAGVTVTLNGTDVDGNAVSRTTTTAADGSYRFTDLPAGTYVVTEPTQPIGYADGLEQVGTAGGVIQPDQFTHVNIGGGVHAAGYHFGELGVPVSGTVFYDQNRDGSINPGEMGIPGVVVELVDENGVVVATTTTGPDGSYEFPNVPPGNYTVRETQPTGYGDSTPSNQPIAVNGTPVTGVNFGDTLSTVSGAVYVDTNNNGVRDGGEVGIGGVVVTLTGTDAAGNPIAKTTTTGADGSYIFTELPASGPNGYTVSEPTQPAGYLDGSEVYGPSGLVVPASSGGPDVITPLVVAAGTDVPGNTFGELVPLNPGTGAISGTVYIDTNQNGTLDPGEVPLAGVTVALTDGMGNEIATTTTDANGNYLFPNVPPGNYTVVESQPDGLGSTTPNDINNITVVAGEVNGGNYFGEAAGSISGTVFADGNNDGVQNGTDAGIGGVTMALLDGDGNPVLNPLTGQSYTVITDAFGNYTFTNLLAGDYTVVESQPAGYISGINTPGSEGGNVSGDAIALSLVMPVEGAPPDAVEYNFAEILVPTGVPVSGTVFHDQDRDGERDPGEVGIPGVVVELLDPMGNVVATTTTGPDGSYLFPSVPPGDYTIRETQPSGYGDPTTGTFAPNTRPISVGAVPVGDQNFGDTLGSLSGSVYLDANRDNTRNPGEPGISGVQVVLTGTDAAGNSVTRTTTTATDGTYTFANLPAGTYVISEVQPTGYYDGADELGTIAGTPAGVAGNDVFTGISLPAGADGVNYVFGEQPPTAPVLNTTFVAGTVFVDPNGNGTLDPGEVGIPGVVIELRDSGGNVVSTTTTGLDGGYLFTNVPPGNYTVVQPTQPGGYGSTSPDTLNITVPPSLTPVVNVNFGEAQASVAGNVYVDANNNGVQDAGELGIGGVILTLTGTDSNGNPVSQTTTTAADGSYLFTGLPPSDATGYTVTETQPTIYPDGMDASGLVDGSPTGTTGNDVLSGIVLPPASTGTQYNFGELPPQTDDGTTYITGTVFLDGNRDGTLTGGETGIGGVTVELVDSHGVVVGTTITNPDGSYIFTDVPPGNYTVRETQPGEYGSSSPNTVSVSVPSDLTPVSGIDFGETTGSIAGSVYNDLNGNGIRDAGEPGIPNVSVQLTGTDVNGNPVSQSATTDVDGNYLFTNLPAGSYTVTEPTQPSGYADGLESIGTAGGVAGNDVIATIPLGGGVQASGYHFGELGVNSLSGYVYLDYDLNAVRTTGPGTPDLPIPGALVLLVGTDTDGNPITRSALTDANGYYEFTDLPAGSYQIIENQDALPTTALPMDGVYDGATSIGSLGGTLPAGMLGNISAVDLTGNSTGTAQNGTDYNFGELPPSDPFGYVFEDINNNGIREPGEPGIAGVPITISGTAFAGTPFARPLTGADVPGGSLTVFTDANGFYQFNPIPPGLYALLESTQPNGYLDGREQNADPNGPFNVVVGNDLFSNIFLNPMPVRGPFNFGEIRPASIAGNVYFDMNRNGVRDPGEAGIPGVVMTLTGTDDRGNPVLVTTTTDGAGNFVFSNLRPGIYNVAETQPADLAQGQNLPGTAGGILVATDIFGQINLGPGFQATNYLFGEVPFNGLRPQPVPPLPPLPPFVSVAPGAELSKRTFLASTDTDVPTRPLTERTTPNFGALGSVNNPLLDTTFISTSEGVGGELVRVFDLTGGQERFRFRPFPGNPGGVRVVTADVNGDHVPDIITAAGPGGSPRVVIYDGNNGAVLASFLAFEETFTGGLFVSAGDIDGDGRADIVVSPDQGGGPRVRVFSGGDPSRVIADFMGIDDPNFRGGARTAVGDIDGDGVLDLVVGAGYGGGPRVSIWNGASLLTGTPTRLAPDFYAFESTLRDGVYLTVGDVDGDHHADVIVGAGPGGAPRVIGFSGISLMAGQPDMIASFYAGDSSNRGGVPVAAVDLDADGQVEVFTGSGAGAPPIARFINPRTGSVIDEFAAEWLEFDGGIYVG